MRIWVCLEFTKYGFVFMGHVVTANKFGKGLFACIRAEYGKIRNGMNTHGKYRNLFKQ